MKRSGHSSDGGYYVIPGFQRPFAWDNENIDDFLDDVVARESEDYFFGSMVVYDDGKPTFAAVVGAAAFNDASSC
jgi:uncharacterized protein with ParB-like and HNH nuclease domain